MNQRFERLNFMAEFLRDPVREFLKAVNRDLGHVMFVVHTWRSVNDQVKLWQQGREYRRDEGIWVVVDDSKRVTDAEPGTSPHNVITQNGSPASVAIDTVPMNPSTGVLLWDTPMVEWQKIYAIAWRYGLDPLGDTIGAYFKRDLCHFEEPAWKVKLAGLHLVQPSVTTPRV